MYKIISSFFLVIFFLNSITAQNNTISGCIYDNNNNENIIGATIFCKEQNNLAISNEYGFYSFSTNKNKINIIVSFIGYKQIDTIFTISQDTIINFYLENNTNIGEVVVIGKNEFVSNSQIGKIHLSIDQVKSLPKLGGETDIIKVMQLLPGIQSGYEGSSNLFVRGGNPEQNLFLIDGVPIYNISHLFGFTSVFNENAVNSVNIIKGGFPARYGGRISSVIDIRMKEGDLNEFHSSFNLSPISSKFMINGPLKKNKASFLISARRTFYDLINFAIHPFLDDPENIQNYYFYDINVKFNFIISSKSRIYFSLYNGHDKYYNKYSDAWTKNEIEYKNKTDNGLKWGNMLGVVRWNYIFNNKLFANTSLYVSKYNFTSYSNNSFTVENFSNNDLEKYSNLSNYNSAINDFSINYTLDYIASNSHYFRTGINTIYHNFLPGISYFQNNTTENKQDTTLSSNNIYATEIRAFVEDDIKISKFININIGLHTSFFSVQKQNYYSFEPRFSGAIVFNDNFSVKSSFSRMQQYLHLLTNTNIGLPSDLWIPVTQKIEPQKANLYSVGLFFNLLNKIDFSIEAYYKDMFNLITYKEGTSFLLSNNTWDETIKRNGKGKSLGIEFFLHKKTGKLQHIVSYTLSKTTRQFQQINNGIEYNYKYDRLHNFSLSSIYNINDKIKTSFSWIFATGNPVTLPEAIYPSILYPPDLGIISPPNIQTIIPYPTTMSRQNTELWYYGERNSKRMPNYHRLDIDISFTKKNKNYERILSFGAYNTYNHLNPFFIRYKYKADASVTNVYKAKGQFVLVGLFPILPYVSLSLIF